MRDFYLFDTFGVLSNEQKTRLYSQYKQMFMPHPVFNALRDKAC